MWNNPDRGGKRDLSLGHGPVLVVSMFLVIVRFCDDRVNTEWRAKINAQGTGGDNETDSASQR